MISFWSVFSASLWFVIASLLLYALRRHENFLMRYGVAVCSMVVILATVRLLLPLDNTRMIVLRSYTVLPVLDWVLLYEPVKGVSVERILAALWLAGALLGLVFILRGLLRDRRRLRQLPNIPPSPQMRSAIQACGLDEAAVRVTPAATVPMAVGLLHPTICLPEGEYTETELRWVLRHEAAHISGHDAWLRLGYLLFRCLFWWNPFVHWGQRLLDDILELRCDKVVLNEADPAERVEYVEALHHMAGRLHKSKLPFVGAGTFVQAGKAGILALRAKQALDAPRPYIGVVLVTVVLSISLFAASYAFIIQPAGLPPGMEDGVEIVQITPETAYLVEVAPGEYQLWCNGAYLHTIGADELNEERYQNLEVHP